MLFKGFISNESFFRSMFKFLLLKAKVLIPSKKFPTVDIVLLRDLFYFRFFKQTYGYHCFHSKCSIYPFNVFFKSF